MNSISRTLYSKGFFHVMTQGLNKEYIFKENYYKDKYIKLIKKYAEVYNIMLVAYCIMDNHAHLLIFTEEVKQMSLFMQNVNSKFAIYYNKDISRVGYVFRGRYNSQYIKDKKYLLNCLNYIHMNPVKANMISRPGDYRYSTYNDYIDKRGIVNDNILTKVFGCKDNYLDIFLNISNKEFEIMDIDREDKNFEIATKVFLEKHETTINEIKQNKELLIEFCKELVVNKKYKQVQVSRLLNKSKSSISKYIVDEKNGENAPSKKFRCN